MDAARTLVTPVRFGDAIVFSTVEGEPVLFDVGTLADATPETGVLNGSIAQAVSTNGTAVFFGGATQNGVSLRKVFLFGIDPVVSQVTLADHIGWAKSSVGLAGSDSPDAVFADEFAVYVVPAVFLGSGSSTRTT